MHRRTSILVAGLAVLLVGCTAAPESDQVCTEIGAVTGIGVTVEPPLATTTADAGLEACWDDVCHTPDLALRPGTTAQSQGCTGDDPDDTCSAQSVRTDDKIGYASIPELPERPVQVTVTLTDGDGTVIFTDDIRVTPNPMYPNGPSCGQQGVQAALVVSEDGLAALP